MILIDSNILIDIFDKDENWWEWSAAQLRSLGQSDNLTIPQIVVGEVGPRFGDIGSFFEALTAFEIDVVPMSDESVFYAGQVFRNYVKRRADGAAKSIIADFLIGAQAKISDAAVLTRDPAFIRSYFPSVTLITPSKDEND